MVQERPAKVSVSCRICLIRLPGVGRAGDSVFTHYYYPPPSPAVQDCLFLGRAGNIGCPCRILIRAAAAQSARELAQSAAAPGKGQDPVPWWRSAEKTVRSSSVF
jgi:hypothetical protein